MTSVKGIHWVDVIVIESISIIDTETVRIRETSGINILRMEMFSWLGLIARKYENIINRPPI